MPVAQASQGTLLVHRLATMIAITAMVLKRWCGEGLGMMARTRAGARKKFL